MLQNLMRSSFCGVERNTSSTSTKKLPHNYSNIIEAEDPSTKGGPFDSRLHAGIFLDQKKRRYWVEENSFLNCFIIYSRGLSIDWGQDARYWSWPCVIERTSKALVEVSELLDVCWLKVQGKFPMSHLSPKTKYEVIFVVMLKEAGYGWDVPVNLKLEFSNTKQPALADQNRQLKLSTLPKAKWVGFRVGEFRTSSSDENGEMRFSLFETENNHWKKGLVIKGVLIRPQKRRNNILAAFMN